MSAQGKKGHPRIEAAMIVAVSARADIELHEEGIAVFVRDLRILPHGVFGWPVTPEEGTRQMIEGAVRKALLANALEQQPNDVTLVPIPSNDTPKASA